MRQMGREAMTQTFSSYRDRKRFRAELEAMHVKIPGGGSGINHRQKRLVNKEPLSTSLSSNDRQMVKMMERASEGQQQDANGRSQAGVQHVSLRDLVAEMAQNARETSKGLLEDSNRCRDWGEKADMEYDFLTSQAKEYMVLRGGVPYSAGEGTTRPLDRIGEVLKSEEAMDDAVVEYARAAGLVSRFRKSTVDHPAPSGAFMRPCVPYSDVYSAQVSSELELVRNRMFRLDSMFKEARSTHSNQLQLGRTSAIVAWKRDKQEMAESLLEPISCIQSAEELMEARLRAVSPSQHAIFRNRSPLVRGASFLTRGSTSPAISHKRNLPSQLSRSPLVGSRSSSARFLDGAPLQAARPKTAGTPKLRGGSLLGESGCAGMAASARPQTSRPSADGSKTTRF